MSSNHTWPLVVNESEDGDFVEAVEVSSYSTDGSFEVKLTPVVLDDGQIISRGSTLSLLGSSVQQIGTILSRAAERHRSAQFVDSLALGRVGGRRA